MQQQQHLLSLLLTESNIRHVMGAVLERLAPYKWERPRMRHFCGVIVTNFAPKFQNDPLNDLLSSYAMK